MAGWPPRHGIARARFFLEKAEHCTVKQQDDFEAYLDGAIVFGRTALLRVESQYKGRRGWKAWWNGIWTNESVQFLQEERNHLLHRAPSMVNQNIRLGTGPDRAASLSYYENADVPANVTVGRHIDATETLVREADERFASSPPEEEAMTDEQLHNYAADHLSYELSMLYETGTRLIHDRDVDGDLVAKNALIESFAIHARSLANFLYPESSPKNDDDVTSFKYVRDVQKWKQARGRIPPELALVKRRTAKQIAHLTTGRPSSGSSEKAWIPEAIVRAFFEPLRLFHEHVPFARLDVSVHAFIANFAAPRPTTPQVPASQPRSQAPGIASSAAPTRTITDVRTSSIRPGGSTLQDS